MVSNWRKLFKLQDALITRRSVHLEVQLIVLKMNGKDSSSLYWLAHDSNLLFILEAQIHVPSMGKKPLPAVRLHTCQICLESAQDKLTTEIYRSPKSLILIVDALELMSLNVFRCHVGADLTHTTTSMWPG